MHTHTHTHTYTLLQLCILEACHFEVNYADKNNIKGLLPSCMYTNGGGNFPYSHWNFNNFGSTRPHLRTFQTKPETSEASFVLQHISNHVCRAEKVYTCTALVLEGAGQVYQCQQASHFEQDGRHNKVPPTRHVSTQGTQPLQCTISNILWRYAQGYIVVGCYNSSNRGICHDQV